MNIIDGKAISKQIKDEVKEKVAALKAQGVTVTLAVVQVGNDPASSVYVNNKKKACAYTGMESESFELPEETTQEELLSLIEELNGRKEINGILVQLPLPKHIDENAVIRAISPKKDVDGFHPQSVGALCIGQPGFVSCTPAGIIELLKRSGIEIAGKECVIIGRSNIVGKPMALLMLRENATGFKRRLQACGYPDRSDRKTADDHGGICQRRSRCHRCGDPQKRRGALRGCRF